MAIRTDLAMEAKALWEQSAGKTTRLQGVTARERMTDGFAVTSVEILNRLGEQALGKPAGTYVSVELPRQEHDPRRPAQAVAQELRQLMALGPKDSVLVVGLGNEAVTPDAVGPKTVAGLFLTRHLIEHLPEYFGGCRSVSAVTPGVLATTGIESIEVVRGACAHVRPDCVLCIDALAAGAPVQHDSDDGHRDCPRLRCWQPPCLLPERNTGHSRLQHRRADRRGRGLSECGIRRNTGDADRHATRHRRTDSFSQRRTLRCDQSSAASRLYA